MWRRRAQQWYRKTAAALIVGLLIMVAGTGVSRPASLRAGTPTAAKRPVTRPAPPPSAAGLAATIAPDPPLVHDGDGIATVALAQISSADLVVRSVRVTVQVPAPARTTGVGVAKGWRCAVAKGGHSVSCALRARSAAASAVAPIHLNVAAVGTHGGRPSFGRAKLQLRGSWLQAGLSGPLVRHASRARLVIEERSPLTVRAHAVDANVIDQVGGSPTPTTLLTGTVARRTSEPISYSWTQVCGRGSCPRVMWTTVTRGVLVPGEQPTAGFAAPSVSRPERLRFRLTASDPRGGVGDVAVVKVVPEQIAHLNPRLKGLRLAGAKLRAAERPVKAVGLSQADRAIVSVGASGAYSTRVGGLVRLNGGVGSQRILRTSWRVSIGPRSMLAGAKRTRTGISFRAPSVPGTYAVRIDAVTRAGSFTRDEIIEVNPSIARASADVAAVNPHLERAFCTTLRAAREHKLISISLPSGGVFSAKADAPAGPADECKGTEKILVSGGSTTLGESRLEAVRGNVTLTHGLEIVSGELEAPKFWKAAPESAGDSHVRALTSARYIHAAEVGGGPLIPFEIPARTANQPAPSHCPETGVGMGIPLTDSGFGDLVGEVCVDHGALSKFPVTSSLPGGWKMDRISLSVAPDARRFELAADASGPKSTGGEISFSGVLTFDGVVSLSVTASNLAVFQSADGQQASLTARGSLTLLPARRFNPSEPNASGSFFPLIDVEVSAAIDNYRPAQNLTLSGHVSWSSHGPLELGGTLVTAVRGTDINLTVEGTFTDANNWGLFAQLASPEGVPIGTPHLLKLKLLEGTLRRNGGQVSISLRGEAADIHGIPGVHAASAKVEFTTSCEFRGEPALPGGAPRVCLMINAFFELKVPGSNEPLTVDGGVKLDLSTLKFEVLGRLSAGTQLGPKEFKLEHMELFVTNAKPPPGSCDTGAAAAQADGVSFGITARGSVLGVPVSFTGAYLAGPQAHYCLGADIGTADLPTGTSDTLQTGNVHAPAQPSCAKPSDPTLQRLRFDYSSETGTGSFVGKFCLPAGVRERLGTIGKGVGTVHLTLLTDGFTGEARYDLHNRVAWFVNALNQDTPDPTKAALGFRSLGFTVSASRTAGASLSLTAHGDVRMPAPTAASGGAGEPASQAPVTVTAGVRISPVPELTFATTLGNNVADEPCTSATPGAITRAFGAEGFNICHLGLQGTIGASGIGLGVNAKFTLPHTWSSELGTRNASFEIGFNVSASTPCLDLSVLQQDRKKGPALDLFNKGAILADTAMLQIAPNGCQLPGRPHIPAGIALKFDGTMFGTPTHVDLKIERQLAGLKIDFTQRTGASSLGPLRFGETSIRVLLDPAQNQTTLGLKTSMSIGTGTVTIDGTFNRSGGTTTLDAKADVHATLLRARFDGTADLHFQSGPGGTQAQVQRSYAPGHRDHDDRRPAQRTPV